MSKPGVNWNRVRADYINGWSQAKLAKKYHVSRNMVARHSMAEGWTEARKAAKIEIQQKVVQKTAEVVADNATLLERAKRGLLMRVVDMIENYPDISAAEFKRKENGGESKYSLKDLAAVLSAVEDKAAKGQSADIEDLAPLGELLRDE